MIPFLFFGYWRTIQLSPAPDRPILRLELGNNLVGNDGATDAKGHWYVTSGSDASIRVWSLPSLKLVKTIYPPGSADFRGETDRVAISSDGRLVAVGTHRPAPWYGDSAVLVFDRRSGDMVSSIRGLLGSVGGIAFNGGGSRLA